MGNGWFGGAVSFSGHKVSLSNSNDNDVKIIDSANFTTTDTPVRAVIKTVGKATETIVNSGATLFSSSVSFIQHFQSYWYIYLMSIAIILVCITFL